jgi:hypothetical protein
MAEDLPPISGNEKVAPTNCLEALRSALLDLSEEMPREVVVEQLDDTRLNAVVSPLNDSYKLLDNPPLNPVERKLRDTIRYCAEHGLLQHTAEARRLIESLRQAVQEGGVFEGPERPYSYYNRSE